MRPLLAAAAAALALPGGAWAHARLLRTVPPDGAVLASAPRVVRVLFDDTIRPAGGNVAIRNGDGSVRNGDVRVHGRELDLPLKGGLTDGDYSVRWSAITDDGHRIQGVLAFAVGAGRAPPSAAIGVERLVTPADVLSRFLFFLGLLVAAGIVVFHLTVWRPLGGSAVELAGAGLFVSLLLVFLGSSSLLHGAATGTRFGRMMEVAATLALVGAFAAAISRPYPQARYPALAAPLGLLVVPTIAGHALDPGRPRPLSAAVDFVHLGATAVWIGGLVCLAYLVPQATATMPELERDRLYARVAGRFSAIALASVAVLAASGVGRALFEFSAVSQLWSTGYGRAVLAKTALFLSVVALAWVNRYRLVPLLAAAAGRRQRNPTNRLRRSTVAELVLLAGAVAAVAVLTQLRPARQRVVAASPAVATPARAPLPPRGALVLARESGELAVGLAVRPVRRGTELTATVLGQDGNGYRGAPISVEGAGRPCGAGCARTVVPGRPPHVSVSVGGTQIGFEVPARAAPADGLQRAARRAFRRLGSLVIDERLASGPGNAQRSRLTVVAPDRLEFRIPGGPAGIVIGGRRWDREPGGRWIPSGQSRLDLPAPYWGPASRNAYVVGGDARRAVVTLLDPRLPAWFRITIDRRTRLPLKLQMTAAAHFMTDRYSSFDRRLTVSPPSASSR